MKRMNYAAFASLFCAAIAFATPRSSPSASLPATSAFPAPSPSEVSATVDAPLAAPALFAASGQSLHATITQVDTSSLMARQMNRLYVRCVGPGGETLSAGADPKLLLPSPEVWESSDGKEFFKAGKADLRSRANADEGISFLLLADNSGSMYDDLEGAKTDDPAETRMRASRDAVSEFLLSISSSKDSFGLAAFNTRYRLLSPVSRDRKLVGSALDLVARPDAENSYTELYRSVAAASADLAARKGRRALVVLSDGENFPYFPKTGKSHPDYGTTTFAAEAALESALRDGVTVFAVNFGTEKDGALAGIALASGGAVFDARNSRELSGAYSEIRARILDELLVSYRPLMLGGDKRYVTIRYGSQMRETTNAQVFYAGTVFGGRGGKMDPLVWLALPLAILCWLLLSLLRFEKPSISANLSLLYAPGAGRGTKMFAIGDRTVIGADAKADITIAGNERLASGPVTVVKDSDTGRFTLVSKESVTVNNRALKTKILEPGDVINFNGTLVVFDDDQRETGKKATVRKKRPGR